MKERARGRTSSSEAQRAVTWFSSVMPWRRPSWLSTAAGGAEGPCLVRNRASRLLGSLTQDWLEERLPGMRGARPPVPPRPPPALAGRKPPPPARQAPYWWAPPRQVHMRTSVSKRGPARALEIRRVFEFWLRTACASPDQGWADSCGFLRYIRGSLWYSAVSIYLYIPTQPPGLADLAADLLSLSRFYL